MSRTELAQVMPWRERVPLEQLRGDIASSRPMLTKGCCKGNNYEQNRSLDFPDEPENNRRNVRYVLASSPRIADLFYAQIHAGEGNN